MVMAWEMNKEANKLFFILVIGKFESYFFFQKEKGSHSQHEAMIYDLH